jgi:hypothetical protein
MNFIAFKPEYTPGERFTGGSGQRVKPSESIAYGALRAASIPGDRRTEMGIQVLLAGDGGKALTTVARAVRGDAGGTCLAPRFTHRQVAVALSDGRDAAWHIANDLHD